MAPTRSRVLLWAAFSGLLWALAWPAVGGLTFVAFVAWLPLLHAERLHDRRTAGRRRAFVPYVLLAVFIWNAACSLWFFAVSEPLGTRLVSGFSPMVVNSLLMIIPWWLKRVVQRLSNRRWASAAFVVFWLAFEHLHHDWDLQWPWFSIGNVLGTDPACIQWYEYTGMLGGSLWILLVTKLLDRAIVQWSLDKRAMIASSATAVVLLAVPLSFSYWRFNALRIDEGPAVEVVIVQPCVDPYTEKFGGIDPLRQLDRMLALAKGAMTDSTVLVVMPETALQEGTSVDMSGPVPVYNGLWENDLERARSTKRLEAFQDSFPNSALLTGMSSEFLYPRDAERPASARALFRDDGGLPEDQQRWYQAYNAALFLPSKGAVEFYNKSKLVAGVESMPFESVLGLLGKVAVDLGGTSGSLGTQEEREVLRDGPLRIVPAICYESVFGEHIAAHIRNGGNLIAIMTNDGWWSDSPGYRQHLTFASIRAIETRRDIVRSANTGISCSVDRKGVIHDATNWWVPAAVRVTVHLHDEITFFVRHGDLIGLVATFCSPLIILVMIFVGARRTNRAH